MRHWGQNIEGQLLKKARNKLNAKVGGINGNEKFSVSKPGDSP